MARRIVARALAEDELTLYGQPVVEAATGRVDHHELLMRMCLDGEIVPPGDFLPHVEDHDLITEVDRWAVRRGAELAKVRPVAINLSARSLSSPELLAEVKRAFGDTGLAERVTFEITETAAAENLAAARELVQELTQLGCGVALDDFGTGYGSFTYLKHLPVTELKIDIEFVRGITTDPADRRVVESIIAIARSFGIRTVAEGVETAETLAVLKSLGVDLVQGYFLGRPAPLEGTEEPGHTIAPRRQRWPRRATTARRPAADPDPSPSPSSSRPSPRAPARGRSTSYLPRSSGPRRPGAAPDPSTGTSASRPGWISSAAISRCSRSSRSRSRNSATR